PKDEILEKIFTDGILYEHLNIHLLPCKALEGKGKSIQVNLLVIPLIENREILSNLRETTSHLGDIVNLGLNYESNMRWFMGTGYVAL
ncbi:hypothetical protein BDF21DRAFT_345540, partial [Thamnidium elegans]